MASWNALALFPHPHYAASTIPTQAVATVVRRQSPLRPALLPILVATPCGLVVGVIPSGRRAANGRAHGRLLHMRASYSQSPPVQGAMAGCPLSSLHLLQKHSKNA
ncbi:hypothetical protein B296_00055417 [Ensete ventricosum]|uniref:Uncharacterized protein n=1 Tax=Ensete ventricosum TaxID=4639 RepID=A0A426WYU1_ENSVE|nr:hypothetical protein B296_00055417 [Ensete ventricosum]